MLVIERGTGERVLLRVGHDMSVWITIVQIETPCVDILIESARLIEMACPGHQLVRKAMIRRKRNERFCLSFDGVQIAIAIGCLMRKNRVYLAIDAPRIVRIWREEVSPDDYEDRLDRTRGSVHQPTLGQDASG